MWRMKFSTLIKWNSMKQFLPDPTKVDPSGSYKFHVNNSEYWKTASESKCTEYTWKQR